MRFVDQRFLCGGRSSLGVSVCGSGVVGDLQQKVICAIRDCPSKRLLRVLLCLPVRRKSRLVMQCGGKDGDEKRSAGKGVWGRRCSYEGVSFGGRRIAKWKVGWECWVQVGKRA